MRECTGSRVSGWGNAGEREGGFEKGALPALRAGGATRNVLGFVFRSNFVVLFQSSMNFIQYNFGTEFCILVAKLLRTSGNFPPSCNNFGHSPGTKAFTSSYNDPFCYPGGTFFYKNRFSKVHVKRNT